MNEVQKRYVRCYLGTILNIGLGAINQGAQRRENEKNRQWQERMYNKYSSPQAQVSQRMAAGLNPYVGVENQSVGSASTSALPSIGPVNPQDIGRYALEVRGAKADIENTQADTNLKQEQARSAWFDNIIKQLDADNYQAIIDAELAVQREEAKKRGAEGDEARLRVKMLEEFVANGGNVYQDTHDLNESIKALNLTQKEYVDVQKALGELNYELTDKYERIRQKAVAMMSVEELKQTRQAVQEFLTTSEFRLELIKLGVDEKRADIVSTNIANALDKIELNTLRNLVGDGGTWKDIPTAIFRKYFGKIN